MRTSFESPRSTFSIFATNRIVAISRNGVVVSASPESQTVIESRRGKRGQGHVALAGWLAAASCSLEFKHRLCETQGPEQAKLTAVYASLQSQARSKPAGKSNFKAQKYQPSLVITHSHTQIQYCTVLYCTHRSRSSMRIAAACSVEPLRLQLDLRWAKENPKSPFRTRLQSATAIAAIAAIVARRGRNENGASIRRSRSGKPTFTVQRCRKWSFVADEVAFRQIERAKENMSRFFENGLAVEPVKKRKKRK